MHTPYTLEVCTGSINSVQAAIRGGAHRIELCSALTEGGLTPSAGLLAQTCNIPQLEIHVLIRPRSGDFLYNQDEVDVMLHDIQLARQLDARGIVIGALTSNGDIDIDIMQALIRQAGPMEITFHRAFDMCRKPLEALQTITSLGCHYLLTSGQAANAFEGQDLLRQLVQLTTDSPIVVMAGGGINSQNVVSLAQATGITTFHASGSQWVNSNMEYCQSNVSMSTKVSSNEYATLQTSSDEIRSILNMLQSMEN